ncbi:hypothetical protein LXA43DRAFT_1065456 [Ganoderma leucocontextum]|nr:hypothetical protein LXA43DRAFT_1065456 [Ganoderma leucocontextum]
MPSSASVSLLRFCQPISGVQLFRLRNAHCRPRASSSCAAWSVDRRAAHMVSSTSPSTNFSVLADWFYNNNIELFRSIHLPCLPSWCANYMTKPSALFPLPAEVEHLCGERGSASYRTLSRSSLRAGTCSAWGRNRCSAALPTTLSNVFSERRPPPRRPSRIRNVFMLDLLIKALTVFSRRAALFYRRVGRQWSLQKRDWPSNVAALSLQFLSSPQRRYGD